MPPAGSPHPGARYDDPKRYWQKIRLLATTLLCDPSVDREDALALFANLNLSSGASGQASKVAEDREFAEWVLRLTRDKLRPRVIVCLGLTSYLRDRPAMRDVFERCFQNIRLSKPHAEHRFKAYQTKRMLFREWDVEGPLGNPIKIVFWPQHPGRAPMTSAELWRDSCEEFKALHGGLFREVGIS